MSNWRLACCNNTWVLRSDWSLSLQLRLWLQTAQPDVPAWNTDWSIRHGTSLRSFNASQSLICLLDSCLVFFCAALPEHWFSVLYLWNHASRHIPLWYTFITKRITFTISPWELLSNRNLKLLRSPIPTQLADNLAAKVCGLQSGVDRSVRI